MQIYQILAKDQRLKHKCIMYILPVYKCCCMMTSSLLHGTIIIIPIWGKGSNPLCTEGIPRTTWFETSFITYRLTAIEYGRVESVRAQENQVEPLYRVEWSTRTTPCAKQIQRHQPSSWNQNPTHLEPSCCRSTCRPTMFSSFEQVWTLYLPHWTCRDGITTHVHSATSQPTQPLTS